MNTPVDFAAWTRALHARGLTVVPPSHPVPVQVFALLTDGGAIRFRCRGTAVTLEEYRDSDIAVDLSPGICGCGCGAQAEPPPNAGRFRLLPVVSPVRAVRFDGRVERGWTGCEAGRLGVPEAAAIFDLLWAALRATTPESPLDRSSTSERPRPPAVAGRQADGGQLARPGSARGAG